MGGHRAQGSPCAVGWDPSSRLPSCRVLWALHVVRQVTSCLVLWRHLAHSRVTSGRQLPTSQGAVYGKTQLVPGERRAAVLDRLWAHARLASLGSSGLARMMTSLFPATLPPFQLGGRQKGAGKDF